MKRFAILAMLIAGAMHVMAQRLGKANFYFALLSFFRNFAPKYFLLN